MLAALFYVVVFIAAAPDELIAFGEIPRSSAGDVIAGEGAALCNVGHAPFQGSIARRRRSLRRRFLQVAYECCRAKRSNGKLRICKLPSTRPPRLPEEEAWRWLMERIQAFYTGTAEGAATNGEPRNKLRGA